MHESRYQTSEQLVATNFMTFLSTRVTVSEKIEELGLTTMKNLFKKLGGWPVLENDWNEESFSGLEIIHICREEGINFDFFIYLTIRNSIKNASTTMINVSNSKFNIFPLILDN